MGGNDNSNQKLSFEGHLQIGAVEGNFPFVDEVSTQEIYSSSRANDDIDQIIMLKGIF